MDLSHDAISESPISGGSAFVPAVVTPTLFRRQAVIGELFDDVADHSAHRARRFFQTSVAPPSAASRAFRRPQWPWELFEDPYDHDFFLQQKRFKRFYPPGLSRSRVGDLGLPQAPGQYERANEQQTRLTLIRADSQNFKVGQDLRLDHTERLILVDSITGLYYQLDVQNGALVVVGPLT